VHNYIHSYLGRITLLDTQQFVDSIPHKDMAFPRITVPILYGIGIGGSPIEMLGSIKSATYDLTTNPKLDQFKDIMGSVEPKFVETINMGTFNTFCMEYASEYGCPDEMCCIFNEYSMVLTSPDNFKFYVNNDMGVVVDSCNRNKILCCNENLLLADWGALRVPFTKGQK
jgi:hypothetical protein